MPISLLYCQLKRVASDIFSVELHSFLLCSFSWNHNYAIGTGPVFSFLSVICFSLVFIGQNLTQQLGVTNFIYNLSYHRCSIIDPGPVASSLGDNIGAMNKKVDMSSVDSKSKELLELAMNHFLTDELPKTIQSCDEIAQLVRNVLLVETPSFRYLPNDKFMIEMLKDKYRDLIGDSTEASIANWWFPAAKWSPVINTIDTSMEGGRRSNNSHGNTFHSFRPVQIV